MEMIDQLAFNLVFKCNILYLCIAEAFLGVGEGVA
jgi:hypothetical protein